MPLPHVSTQPCHINSFTHHAQLCHRKLFHNIVKHTHRTLPHTTLSHTQIFHTEPCQLNSFTRNIVTDNCVKHNVVTHTHLSHTHPFSHNIRTHLESSFSFPFCLRRLLSISSPSHFSDQFRTYWKTLGRLAWHASRHVTFRMLLRGSRGTCGTGPRSSDCCLRFFSLQFVTTLYSFIQWFILTHTHDIVTRKSLTHLLSHTPPLPHTVMVAHSPPPISVLSISFLTIVWYLLEEIDMRGDPVLSFSK